MGLSTGLAFAAHGLPVFGYDIKPEIRTAVASGSTPYQEVELGELLKAQLRSQRFHVVDSPEEVAERAEGIFLCVPTPSLPSGRIDVRPLEKSAEQIGSALMAPRGYRLVVVKSTVVPGTTQSLVAPIIQRRSGRSSQQVGVASNPEFLAEGTMVRDALHPDRIVLGTNDRRSLAWLRRVYRPFHAPIFNLSPAGAELVKYSANAFLAVKVSFANELSRLADRLGVNVDSVVTAVGHDPRIGERFLQAGPGFGGSCFEKDLRALVARSTDLGLHFRSGEAALRINQEQLAYVVDRIRAAVGPLSGKKLALLGLSFKAGTDDVRESRALLLARELVTSGATVRGHDPVALENFRRAWDSHYADTDGHLKLFNTVEEALNGADAAILQADWPIYARWPSAWSRRMKRPLLVDLRRALNPRAARRAGLTVLGLGAGNAHPNDQRVPRRVP
jgi:UDPglucose 6-dehydrogenase